jgi:hypothetical protein
MKIHLITLFFIIISCSENKKNKVEAINKDSIPLVSEKPIILPDTNNCKLKIDQTIGFLKMINSGQSFILKDINDKSTINVSLNKIKTLNAFLPFAYHNDYNLLVFRCVERTKEFYKIIVNEKSNKTMLLSDKNKNFKFQSWSEHILDACCIGFEYKSNPIRESKFEKANIIDEVKDAIFFPIKIEGDWLQVKWGEEKDWKYGWILWKTGNCVLIEIFYFA